MHTVVAADAAGRPLRVVCGYCHSEHNYRGGPRIAVDERGTSGPDASSRAGGRGTAGAAGGSRAAVGRNLEGGREAFPLVGERERIAPAMSVETPDGAIDLEMLLRRVIREESGLTPVVPAEKWRGGTLALRPGNPQLQEKTWPVETFFHKIVMLRNRLRTLEQQVNATELPEDVKIKLQGYISGCYGSLTSFNVLFADDEDQFRGAGGE
jgi:hypothetical protein